MSSEASTMSREVLSESPRPRGVLDRIYAGVAKGSQYVAFAALLVMMFVMVAEVLMRYFVGEPLGWNISLIEKILLPGLVFLGLPWAYSVGAHVAAELVYDRLPSGVQRVLDWAARVLLVVCVVALAYAGMLAAAEAFALGSAPPPLSSQVPVDTWIWRSFLPVGAALMLVLVLIDVARSSPTSRSES
ncbi:TRAP transporter small permease (plasmid) [Citricoccus sp. SGAir0253]|uniref:TRAP transporter small permease n=1 Tax=Citricoccus sp. SGAir0253 TaxID=2567881 RepID=UPI0010CD2F1C|nr:TRAP transporter small permease [Citricoccus sp. SGAir0253]QCU79603.1 TRAP transporter small permease [Citricoccus sp. SGAir0253]